MDVIVSDAALKDGDERLFPESRNRSARIRKKLIKRHGGEFRKVPCIYQMGNKLVAHPVMYERLKQEFAEKKRSSVESAFYSAMYGERNPW